MKTDKYGLELTSRRFEAVLFFAVMTLGAYLFILSPNRQIGILIPSIILICLITALTFCEKIFTKKLCASMRFGGFAILFVLMAVSGIISFLDENEWYAQYNNEMFGFMAFLFLIAIELLYISSEIFEIDIRKKISKWCGHILAIIFLIISIILVLTANTTYSSVLLIRADHTVPIFVLISAVSATVFAITEFTNKWVNILQAITYMVIAIIFFLNLGNSTHYFVVSDSIYVYSNELQLLFGAIFVAIPFCLMVESICKIMYGTKIELIAKRITACVYVVFSVFMFIYLFDTMSINFALQGGIKTIAQWVRVFALICIICRSVQMFRFDLLLKGGKKA